MPRSYELYLQDMLQAGQSIETFTAGKSFSDYESDPLLRGAVERKFEIVGEAVNQSHEYYPEQPALTPAQSKIVNFRNRVIHGYFDVNDEIVWSAVKVYLPPFLAEVAAAFERVQA